VYSKVQLQEQIKYLAKHRFYGTLLMRLLLLIELWSP